MDVHGGQSALQWATDAAAIANVGYVLTAIVPTEYGR
jgi:hypothetical protein